MADQHDAVSIASDAYLFGYPLVLSDVTRLAYLASTDDDGAPVVPNRFAHRRTFPDATFRAVVRPNVDTMYSSAFVDLSNGPVLLSVPAVAEGRYYLVQVLSAWTEVVASPGTRTTGRQAATFVLLAPGWESPPAGTRPIPCPTADVMLIARVQVNGAEDLPAVRRVQDGLLLDGAAAAPSDPVWSGPPPTSPPPAAVAAMSAGDYLDRLARLLGRDPPAEADGPAMERFAEIGLRPGRYDAAPGLTEPVARGIEDGRRRLEALTTDTRAVAGWRLPPAWDGRFGTDYARRAAIARHGFGANMSADAVYPSTAVDATGEPLHGAHRYRLRFGPGATPPSRAFWSLTVYDEGGYLVDNPLRRYALGDRYRLRPDDDGGLSLWLSTDPPAAGTSNWLPVPAGPFSLLLRIYWPRDEALSGGWAPPAVERLG